MKLRTYLNYGGNCEQAFRFYEKHLRGKITAIMTRGQQPGANNVAPELKNTILMLRDKFDTSWMIIHQRPPPPSA